MRSQSIGKEQWMKFADAFSRSHDGWPASLEVREAESPMRVEVDDSVFRGATVEKRDGRETFVLTFGDEPEEHFAHIIHNPLTVATAESDDHTEASLTIESGEGAGCVLALSNPMREVDEDYAQG